MPFDVNKKPNENDRENNDPREGKGRRRLTRRFLRPNPPLEQRKLPKLKRIPQIRRGDPLRRNPFSVGRQDLPQDMQGINIDMAESTISGQRTLSDVPRLRLPLLPNPALFDRELPGPARQRTAPRPEIRGVPLLRIVPDRALRDTSVLR